MLFMFSQWQVAVQAGLLRSPPGDHSGVNPRALSARVVFSRHYLGWRLRHECRLCSDHALRLGRLVWFDVDVGQNGRPLRGPQM